MRGRSMRVFGLLLLVAACGDDAGTLDGGVRDGADVVVDAPTDANLTMPVTLADTGLCTDPACTTFAADVLEYEPQFPLYADTASKRRWVHLPAGQTIDTTSMDYWVFPVGTKFWKDFVRDGVRVETRFITKLLADDNAPGAWFYATYQWNQAQNATTLVTDGAENANGTGHDIPSRPQCRECHDGLLPTRILGFGAIQLDFTPANSALLDLSDLIAMNALSAPPVDPSPRFPLPGTLVEKAALGYMHANCMTCHNPTSDNFGHTQVDMQLRTDRLASVAATPAYTTLVGQIGMLFVEGPNTYTTLVLPGDPDNSILIARMNSLNPARRMPKLGAEITDADGLAALRAWINAL